MRWLFKKKKEKEKSQPHPILYHILEVLNFKKHQKKTLYWNSFRNIGKAKEERVLPRYWPFQKHQDLYTKEIIND